MPLDDLADVTRSLMRLLELNVGRLMNTPLPDTPIIVNVSAEPPEGIEDSVQNRLNLHLYHVAEDPYYKNLPGPGLDPPNVATNPMGLCLYYILTAHHGGAADDGSLNALTQQRLLGYALKTFHDNPVITERTRVGDLEQLVWPEDPTDALSALRGNNNQIQCILRPVTPEDAMAFWGTEERQTTRFSAYYEMRVMFLEPERPARIPGTVLELGQFVFQLGTPHLESSRSRIRFIVPGPGGGVRISQITPARVTLNNQSDAPAEHNRVELVGANLSAGTSRRLVLSTTLWDAEFSVDPLLPGNEDWAVTFKTDRIDVTLATQLTVEETVQTVLPGIYTAKVRAVVAEQVLAGRPRQQVVSSNVTTFAVAPRLIDVQQPDPEDNALIRINLGNEFSLADPALEQDDAIQVIVDGIPYERVGDPPAEARQFSVRDDDPTNPSPVFNAIRLRPHDTLAPGLHPFRMNVNGAESAPFWIEVPSP